MISLIFLGSITVNFEQISCTHWYGDFPIDLDHPSRQLHVQKYFLDVRSKADV